MQACTVALPSKAPAILAIHTEPVTYPVDAKREGLSGGVAVEFQLTSDGHVTHARVILSCPLKVFDDAALDVIRKCVFDPSTSRPDVSYQRVVAFVIDGDESIPLALFKQCKERANKLGRPVACAVR